MCNDLDVRKHVSINVAARAPAYEPADYLPRTSALLLNGGGKIRPSPASCFTTSGCRRFGLRWGGLVP